MKKQALVVRTMIILALALCLAGCGGGNATRTNAPASPPQSAPAPPPAITSMTPSAAAGGGPAFTLTVNGRGFANGDTVFWQVGNLISARQTTFVSTTQILAAIPASDILAPGAVAVFVPQVNSETRSNLVTFPIFPVAAVAQIERVSVAGDGVEANGGSYGLSVSADGRYVAFGSEAGNLVAGDSNNEADVFLLDTCLGASAGCAPATIRVSVADDGSQAFHALHGSRFAASISGNGRFVAFTSASAFLVAGDPNGFYNVFVRDTCIGAAPGCLPSTSRVSLTDGGSEARGGDSFDSAVSSDGRFIAFTSSASNLVPTSSGAQREVFLRDTCAGVPDGCTPTTRRISAPLTQYSFESLQPVISADGRFVLFLGGNEDSENHVFVGFPFLYDACIGAPAGCVTTTLVLSQSLVTQPAAFIHSPAISADGRSAGFASSLSNLVANDNNAWFDVFLVRMPRP